jgi:hypothetical protein
MDRSLRVRAGALLHPRADRRTIEDEEVMRMADSSMDIDAPSTSVVVS